MFYSHEVLTSRKYGIATVWLVATLGAKSTTTKKVTRKAILNVDVPKACEAILEPDVPLALRLQSSLLYGVTRVYAQQCSYVLADAQSTQNSIRTAFTTTARDIELDPEVGRARPDQLVLEDDPSYLPDFALAPLDYDDLDLELPSLTRSSSLSSLRHSHGPRRSISLEDQQGGPVFGIQVPSSDTSGFNGIGGFVVPGDEGPGTRVPGGSVLNVEDEGFEPGVDFGFDEEGNLVEHASAEKLHRTPLSGTRPALMGRGHDQEMDINITVGEDDEMSLLPEAEPFPSTRGHLRSTSEHQGSEEVIDSSSVIQAPIRRRPRRRIIPMDETLELRNADLADWMNGYIDNMIEARRQKFTPTATMQAKRNAEYWVLGLGLGGIGAIVGNTGLAGPLDKFRGEALLLSLGIIRNADKKRGHQSIDDQDKSDGDGRRVRPRSEEEEIGRGDIDMEDGGLVNIDEKEHDVEAAREAEPEQEERDLSQMFPWNVTASVRNSSLAPSARRALGFGGSGVSTSAGGSVGGLPGSIKRRGRLISESPLHGRGLHRNLEPLPSSEADELGDDTLGGIGEDVVIGEDDEFEMYGAAAAGDTQTATESQVVHAALTQEMENFGMFIFDSLKQKEEDVAAAQGFQPVESVNEILFEDILPPNSTNKIVAAQGFIHLLTLASLGRVSTRQDEPFGEIGMSLPYADEDESVH
ncbi:rad21 rec8 n terminal domain-containing protein [Diplodia corticola]|uniref:Rad21 rec8 n terminal domain-containing protein n=1 Tax=Diplodia corticola TaxID=236234 RepID=A0A1J9S7P2_9PEZI|nr:rad21 rec8 n terminal domain-containing protein [Diplodia corticola]OJD35613.1 rad21 rec8 n terminal domain-containing protein [Diplodia corticola]